ncbi:MAG: hypothetical protein A2W35_06800 [Chloroflexi bacterium RBG_16_57_11]|nr:MAG: hypothetical protein A2W35_06800 [Chloroflexi bacterium RBG_16_57_11]
MGRTLYELQELLPAEWLWILDEERHLLEELPPTGGQRLFELRKQIPERRAGRDQLRSPVEQLRDSLIRMSEHWPQYRVFDWQNDVHWTNNGTEQVNVRTKMRSRTVRSYKTRSGMLAGLMLAGSGTT